MLLLIKSSVVPLCCSHMQAKDFAFRIGVGLGEESAYWRCYTDCRREKR